MFHNKDLQNQLAESGGLGQELIEVQKRFEESTNSIIELNNKLTNCMEINQNLEEKIGEKENLEK
jgi:hypothetical protein